MLSTRTGVQNWNTEEERIQSKLFFNMSINIADVQKYDEGVAMYSSSSENLI